MNIDRKFLRNLILYGVIGAISSGMDALIFWVLAALLRLNSLFSNVVSVHCGIFLSFFLNSRYNFKKEDHGKQRFAAFYLTGLFGLALSEGILLAGERLGYDTMITKLVSIVIVALVQFFINRAVAFRDR